jgi:hypothetical protein
VSVQVQGIIDGKLITLEHEIGLPPGQAVIVSVEPRSLTVDEKRRLVDELCGAWAEDSSIGTVFAEIEDERSAARPREVEFDVSS